VEKVVSFLFHVNLLDKSRNTKTGKQKTKRLFGIWFENNSRLIRIIQMVKFWIKKFNRINFLFNFKLNKIKKIKLIYSIDLILFLLKLNKSK